MKKTILKYWQAALLAIIGMVAYSLSCMWLSSGGNLESHKKTVQMRIKAHDGCKTAKIKKILKRRWSYRILLQGCDNHWLFVCNVIDGCTESRR